MVINIVGTSGEFRDVSWKYIYTVLCSRKKRSLSVIIFESTVSAEGRLLLEHVSISGLRDDDVIIV